MYIVRKYAPEYAYEAQKFQREGREFLGWSQDITIDLYHVYHLENADEAARDRIVDALLDDSKGEVFLEIPELDPAHAFRFRQVSGQYNENEQMVQGMIQTLLGFTDIQVQHSKIYQVNGLSEDDLAVFKEYVLNPVENVEIDLHAQPVSFHTSTLEELDPVQGFNEMNQEELAEFSKNFSMDLDDLSHCQAYFRQEGREPNLTELKVIDTYWSDHCRHTTFNTHIDKIEIEAGPYEPLFQAALADYMHKREALERQDRPVTLMDLGTIQGKFLRDQEILTNVEISAEINACALEIKVDVDGDEEDWILYFKNETHNHPTEIEPFGGASTCVGGGIRDPLSGRSWVYQAMRISGAQDPTLPLEATHPDKLPQRVISLRALEGNSDYGNQIGVTAGYAEEVYHPGFQAKRLEVGALISAAPRSSIIRLEPTAGDKIILLGGRTGRDGLGAAVGSSQIQTEESLEDAGAEVQKGAAAVQRKIMRLFRNQEATELIKRCNDFGAGGVSVAVGELTDGLVIDLDLVPVKYDGMHGGEIALSESQERMAVVVAPEDVDRFIELAAQEDVEYAVIADVTEDKRMKMNWQGREIINLSREFLDSNGADKHTEARLLQPQDVCESQETVELSQAGIEAYVSTLNRANQQGMGEQFDSTVGRGTLLSPYGGKHRRTKELGMVSKLPVLSGNTTTTSGMAYGYHPDLATTSPFHGGYYAVIESVSRMVALGFKYQDLRLTFQEYFENLRGEADRWGKPVLALLGANQAMDGLQLASIGGKDSMSGTYQDIDVPPTLISFAVAQGHINNLLSRAFKQVGSQVVLVENPLTEEHVIDLELQGKIYDTIYQLAQDQAVLAVSTVGYNGLLKEALEMSYGNGLGVELSKDISDRLAEHMMGSFILEFPASADLDQLLPGLQYQVIGSTTESGLKLGDVQVDLDQVQEAANKVLATVYPIADRIIYQAPEITHQAFDLRNPVAQPKALVPVLYGTTGEYDMASSLMEDGFEVETYVMMNSTADKYQESVTQFVAKLKDSHLLAFPNGSVYGNQPDDPAKAWDIILNHPEVTQAIQAHLEEQRLIIGSGTGLSVLINSGLIEYGQVQAGTKIQVLANENGKFIDNVYDAQVVSKNNAFTAYGEDIVYTAPVAQRYGRIVLNDAQVDPSQVVSVFTEYYAQEHIDGLASANGLVFGSLSMFDRVSGDLFQNGAQVNLPPFIRSAYRYFQGI